tara:strand:- start:6775 stop:7224 length:450 start_codon:yes stop_codon:yes gene_type:complete
MRLIAHRGNISGPNKELENTADYIDQALINYDAEIDVRLINGSLFLGHDVAQYKVEKSWLLDRAENLWIHCKDYQSLSFLTNTPLKTFYHSSEICTAIRNEKNIWCHDLNICDNNSVIPLLSKNDLLLLKHLPKVHAVCSDFVSLINEN